MGSLGHWEQAFNSVGWFIPPYIQMGALSAIAGGITARGSNFNQSDLEQALSELYEPYGLASMVTLRYPLAPIIKDYSETIAEAVEAHFFGLNHVAIGGLVPVLEGAGRQLAAQRNIPNKGVCPMFVALADYCKNESKQRNMGDLGEVESMMNSFSYYMKNFMYVDSKLYPLADKTNRHGISHGAYSDAEYGTPLNFFKTIAAVDFLTFVSSFRANISWLAPNPSPASHKLASYYQALKILSTQRVR